MMTSLCSLRAGLPTRLLLLVLLALLLGTVPNAPVARATAAGPYLYIPSSAAGKLIKANLDGTSPANLLTLTQPTGIAIDVKHGYIYIADTSSDTVTRYDLDGTDPRLFPIPLGMINNPMGLALDLVNDKIYIASSGNNKIVTAELDDLNPGQNATVLSMILVPQMPWDIALDLARNKMYVTNYGNGKVITATLTGANAAEVDFGAVTFTSPTGIALDFDNDKMYVANYDNDTVIRAGLDGSSAIVLTNLGTSIKHPSGIAVDPGDHKIYIASTGGDGTPTKIVRALLDGGNPTDLTASAAWNGLLSMPYFLAFDTPPDLEVTFYLEPASVPVGNAFNWYMQISNLGPNPAVFTDGQMILRDDLPLEATYGDPFIANDYLIAQTGPIFCEISSNILTCYEGGGTASFAPAASKLVFNFKVTTNAVGALTNPKGGGVCKADPVPVLVEINTANNICSSTITVATPPSTARGQGLYVQNLTLAVARGNLDGSGGVNLGNPGGLLAAVEDMAIDTQNDWMYFTNNAEGKIIRAHLNGTGAQDLGNLGGQLTKAAGIALDVVGDRMYVASFDQNKVFRAHLDGSSPEEIANLTGKVNGVDAIAADLVHTRLYIAGWASNNVYRLGPGDEKELTGLNGLLTKPESIAVDPYSGYLFVVDGTTVVRSDLDGNGATKLNALSSSCPAPRGIAVDASGHIYVGCAGANKVIRAGLDGSNIVNLGSLNATVVSPNAVAIDPRGFLLLPLLVR